MKHKIYLCLFPLMLLLGNVLYAQNVYTVSEERVNLDPISVQLESPGYTAEAFTEFLNKNGYVANSFHQGRNHLTGEILSPVLNNQNYSYTKGRILFDIQQKYNTLTIAVSSNCIEIYFPNTQIKQTYNPSVCYPINPIYEEKKIFIEQSAAQKTFDRLISEMFNYRKKLIAHLTDYLPVK